MEQGPSDRLRDESWSAPAEEGHKPSKAKRSRNRRRNGRHMAAVQFEAGKSANESQPAVAEATIWERPSPERAAERIMSAIRTEAVTQLESQVSEHKEVERPQEQQTPAKLEAQKPALPDTAPQIEELPKSPTESREWVDDFATAPETTYPQELQPIPAPDQQTSNANIRPYFWTEPDIRQPNQTAIDHDMLPPVLPSPLGENAPQEIGLHPTVLEQAVNPNIVAEEVAAHAAAQRAQEDAIQVKRGGFGSLVSPAANLLTRRHTRGGVKSQPMKPNFESSVPFPVDAEEAGTMPAPVEFGMPGPEYGQVEQSATMESDIKPPFAPAETPEHPERLGHMLVAAEQSTKPETGAGHMPISPEQQMQQAELVEMSKTIRIDGVSIYEMFTAKRIDQEGLHRIVVEYLRGGDIKKMIAGEVMRQQLKFERDPQLRNVPVDMPEKVRTSRVKEQAKSLLDLEKNIDRTEKVAEFTQKEVAKAQHYLRANPRVATAASITTIVVIYSLILIIALSK